MSDLISLTVDSGIATLTLSRPDKRNAINAQMTDEMTAAFDQIETDPAIRVAVLTGAGRVFCAGMDLGDYLDGRAPDILFGPHGFGGLVKRRRTTPLIAAVEGAALAGGFELTLACDMICAGRSARFGLPEPRLGLVAGGGGAARLARLLPRQRAAEILLTADNFSAVQMHDWGVINRLTDDGQALPAALTLARAITETTADGIAASLALMDCAAPSDADWALNDQLLAPLETAPDTRARIAALLGRASGD